ncbi:exosome component 10-like [Tigriopus californicus]|uniref:exosome component 10-like n=1 Tax=Tigriopus californicus TaxID=6832 RepID=UPI0027D9EDDB|nr:exosome component 10-like [Tigriopus californicus]|eukprot:TCALIF_00403-PA protein Name:"Similar to Exosc10 Exosome component 10 (Mus musculus)" AED:0.25 eAED:0.25 QI:0/-1/0/1/-1/1/1/0/834
MAQKDEAPPPGFLPGHTQTLDEFSQTCLKTIAQAIQTSNQLPSKEKKNFEFYQTFKAFRHIMDTESSAILGQMEKLMRWNRLRGKPSGLSVPDMMDLLTECNDQLLERININLDEVAGLKKTHDPVLLHIAPRAQVRLSGQWNARDGKTNSSEDNTPTKLVTAKYIPRPQARFRDCIDNSLGPFIPSLKEKPHSQKPLSILVEQADDGSEFYSHPYQYELTLFQPRKTQMQRVDPIPEVIVKDQAKYTLVNDSPALMAMMKELKKATEIAVDVEHHWYRSFLGITCLIQISTWDQDFVIDPFSLWRELTVLNEVLTDPKIVKVLHGADHDVIWLQRDFSLYIVNLFDTHIAAKTLNYPPGTRSYANLLQRFCQVRADKQFQLADWRIRPLPECMVDYARTDTRYLLYIYKRLKNDLIDQGNEQNNLLRATWEGGTLLCQTRFEKPLMTERSHLDFLLKSRTMFNSRQLHALSAIFQWRDKVARQEDESPSYVLPNHMLLKICQELPREMQGILACCSPVPPLVKQSLHPLHMMILAAREQPLTHVHVTEAEPVRAVITYSMTELVSDPLKSPLDLSRVMDLDSQVLMDSDGKFFDNAMSTQGTKSRPIIGVFGPTPGKGSEEQKKPIVEPTQFLSPYQRFVMLKPYLKYLEAQGDSKKDATDKERIESIKEHFAVLTALTTAGEKKVDEIEVKSDDKGGEEEPPVEDENEGEEYEEEERPIKKLREGIRPKNLSKEVQKHRRNAQKNEKKKIKKKQQPNTDENQTLKRKSAQSDTSQQQQQSVSDDLDFSQFHSKKKRPNNQMNEWKDFKDATKKGGCKKKRFQGENKSMSYKK